MASRGSVRRRSVLVATATALVVLGATTSVGAHDGGDDDGTVHACVSPAGQIRVLDDERSETCRRNETPLHWAAGTDGGQEEALEVFKQQLLDGTGEPDLVHWARLAGVPEPFADGVLELGEIADLPEWLEDGEVSVDEVAGLPAGLADGLTYADIAGSLPADAVRGGAGGPLEDFSVTAHDLAGQYGSSGEEVQVGAVTGEKIADGTIGARDLAPGAVTPGAIAPEVAMTTSVPLSLGDNWSTGAAPSQDSVTVPAGGLVMVSGQVQLSLITPCLDCSAVVRYRVLRSDGVTSPTYSTQLSAPVTVTQWQVVEPAGVPGPTRTAHGQTVGVASISWLDEDVPAGEYGYTLQLTRTEVSPAGTVGVMAENMLVTAQVLGAR